MSRVPPALRRIQGDLAFTLFAAALVAAQAANAQARLELDLRIGGGDRGEEYEFHRIGGVHVFPHGEIAILDNGSAELRVYSPAGTFLRRIARSGDGPGEYRGIGWLMPGLGTVGLSGETARLSVLTPEGRVTQTFVLTVPGVNRWTPLRETTHGWVAWRRLPLPAGTSEAHGTVAEMKRSVHLVDRATLQPGPMLVELPLERRIANAVSSSPPLFDGLASFGVDTAGRIYTTTFDKYQITVRSSTGAIIRTITPPHERRPITQAMVDAYAARVRAFYAQRSARYQDERWRQSNAREAKEMIDDRIAAWKPANLPVTGELLVAASGALWVERIDIGRDPVVTELRGSLDQVLTPDELSASSSWDRFDPAGGQLDRVELPSGFRPMFVTETTAIGVSRDSDGVESVVRYRVVAAGR